MSDEITLDDFTEQITDDNKSEIQTTRLENHISIIKGTKPDRVLDEPNESTQPYLVISSLDDGKQKYTPDTDGPKANPQDTMMIMDGSKSGRVYSGKSGIIGSTMAAIRPEGVNPDYLRYVLESKYKRLNAATKGSAVPHTDKDLLRSLEILTPPPPEQRKIATVLYTVDRAIEKTREIIEQVKKVKQALTQDVFHGRHKDFKDYQTTPVGEIPTHWSVFSIGDAVHTAQYGISESLSEEGQYPIFRMNNIENGRMVDKPLKYIDLDDEEFEKYRVERGDILFNRTNSLKLVGKTGIYELEGDHVFASYLVRLQTNASVNSHYLNYYMNSSEAQNRMMDFATKGVSQANINANSIQQVKLPLPSVEEQKNIVERLNSIDSQIETNKKYNSQLQRLKRGLMQDLLSGTVRTTDTNIEVPDKIEQYG